jgi:hypothetical protein
MKSSIIFFVHLFEFLRGTVSWGKERISRPISTMAKWFKELRGSVKGLPPYFSLWFKIELKSPMTAQTSTF